MIDPTKSMNQIATEEPAFGEFLRAKGFPFSVSNPITKLVTFNDVVKLKKLDGEAFLAEYEAWAAEREAASAE